MNKRQKNFEGMCIDACLKLLDWKLPASQASRIGGHCQAGNGAIKQFSIAARDSGREDLNILGWMKRFAKDNAATAMSEAVRAVAPALAAPMQTPPHKPRAVLRVVQEATKAPPPAVAPPPEPARPAVAAPVISPPTTTTTPMTKPAANDSKTFKRAPSVRMTRADFHALTKHIESIDVTTFDTMPELATACASALKIVVTHTHVKEAVEVLGITHFKRVRMTSANDDGKLALELARATAGAVRDLMQRLGEKPTAQFVEALRGAGIDLAQTADRKAA